jgi:hypothetical protein
MLFARMRQPARVVAPATTGETSAYMLLLSCDFLSDFENGLPRSYEPWDFSYYGYGYGSNSNYNNYDSYGYDNVSTTAGSATRQHEHAQYSHRPRAQRKLLDHEYGMPSYEDGTPSYEMSECDSVDQVVCRIPFTTGYLCAPTSLSSLARPCIVSSSCLVTRKRADINARKVNPGAGQMTVFAGNSEDTATGKMVAWCITCAQKTVIRSAEGRWRGQRPRLIAQQTICKVALTLT